MAKTKPRFHGYATSFLYSLGVTFSMYIAITELHRFKNTSVFLVFSLVIFLILFLENSIAVLARSRNIELNLNMNDQVNELWHLFYKLVLPLGYYLSLVAFGYYNLRNFSLYFVLLISLITFFVLFVNTKAFFNDIKTLESKTHYVYDIIKFLIFFTLVNTISNYYINNQELIAISTLVVGLLAFAISSLMVWRVQKLNHLGYIYTTFLGIIVSVSFFLLNTSKSFNPLQISLGLLFVFYLSIAIIHHVLLNTLTKAVLLEYLVIAAVIFAVVYGIS